MDYHAIAVYPIFLMQLYPHYISCANHLRMQSKHTRGMCIGMHSTFSSIEQNALCSLFCSSPSVFSSLVMYFIVERASAILMISYREYHTLWLISYRRNGNHSRKNGRCASIARGDKKMIYVRRIRDSACGIPWRGSRENAADAVDDAERSS